MNTNTSMNTNTDYNRTKYFMDDPREAARLDAKVDPDQFISDFLKPVLSSDPQRIVDVGCGAGAIISTLAKKYPQKEFIGVDISGARIREAQKKTERLENIGFYEASIYQIPLESNSVDVVYTRFLLEYLKEPVKAIAELSRITKPGGQIVLQDLDGQLLFQYPYQVPEIGKVFEVLAETTGFDPYIGRKLFAYSRQVGLSLVNMDIRAYHLFAGKIDAFNRHLWEMKLEIALPQFAEALGSLQQAQELKTKYMDFLDSEDTFLYSNLFTLYLSK
jgi:ubiquinone/menaquinone biosynthesis C-methylase UbiE